MDMPPTMPWLLHWNARADSHCVPVTIDRYLDHYMANVGEPGRKLTMVLSVGYWVWFPEVPQVGVLNFLGGVMRIGSACAVPA